MNDARDITDHYTSGDLLARLEAQLREDGVDPSHATAEALASYDHFHGRGLEATEEMAALLRVAVNRPVFWMSAAVSAGPRATWPGASAAVSAGSI